MFRLRYHHHGNPDPQPKNQDRILRLSRRFTFRGANRLRFCLFKTCPDESQRRRKALKSCFQKRKVRWHCLAKKEVLGIFLVKVKALGIFLAKKEALGIFLARQRVQCLFMPPPKVHRRQFCLGKTAIHGKHSRKRRAKSFSSKRVCVATNKFYIIQKKQRNFH